jgi:hypothetical protein
MAKAGVVGVNDQITLVVRRSGRILAARWPGNQTRGGQQNDTEATAPVSLHH